MKKIFLLLLTLLLFLLTSCDPYADKHPINYHNTFWVSDNPKLSYYVGGEESGYTKGIIYSENNLEFTHLFSSVWVETVDYDDNTIFSGKGNFNKESFSITVTRSNVNSIAIDDVIIFNRIDGLPEWAIEMLMSTIGESDPILD